MAITWQLSTFTELTKVQLYAILALRQQVFIVEQQCIYQDCDGRDINAYHLLGLDDGDEQSAPVAYLRILPPQKEGGSPSIGRVLTHPDARGKSLGKQIMARCLYLVDKMYPNAVVTVSAQQYLIRFYEYFGFQIASEGYDEDGIPHIRMVRNPSTQQIK